MPDYSKTRIQLRRGTSAEWNTADPVLGAIIRGLANRIGDANELAEKHWQELSLYKSLN